MLTYLGLSQPIIVRYIERVAFGGTVYATGAALLKTKTAQDVIKSTRILQESTLVLE